MKFSEAKTHFKDATKVVCLVRKKEIEIVPNTVSKSIFYGQKTFWATTVSGVSACIVDNEENQIAKIVK